MTEVFVLVFQYFDKSGTYICGVTQNPTVAHAWRAAGNGEHQVYKIPLEVIRNHTTGWQVWKT